MIFATASLHLAEEAQGVFTMTAEQKYVNILVESADTVAKAVYKSDQGEHYYHNHIENHNKTG